MKTFKACQKITFIFNFVCYLCIFFSINQYMLTDLNSLQNLSRLTTQMSEIQAILSEKLHLKTQSNTSLSLTIKRKKKT